MILLHSLKIAVLLSYRSAGIVYLQFTLMPFMIQVLFITHMWLQLTTSHVSHFIYILCICPTKAAGNVNQLCSEK